MGVEVEHFVAFGLGFLAHALLRWRKVVECDECRRLQNEVYELQDELKRHLNRDKRFLTGL